MKLHITSLGCAKNTVDSENLLGLLEGAGVEIVENITGADTALVNTCGFIQPAVEESVSAILDLELLKEQGKIKRIAVVGCLVNRYGEELKKELPSVDFWAKAEEWLPLLSSLGLTPGMPRRGRLPETRPWTRYLKVGEGCDTRCSYCTIPSIRGRARSVPLAELIDQGVTLAREGARELCLVGQDLTIYGRDLSGRPLLRDLLEGLERELPPSVWIRLLYLHPSRVDEQFIDFVAASSRILPCLDIPIQHIDGEILKRMNRPDAESHIRKIFAYARRADPLFALRTTVMVGFPGETERQFGSLLDFLEETKIDRVGAFVFSPEEGTAASRMAGQIPAEERERRYARLLELQSEVSLARQQLFIGKKLTVLLEELRDENGFAWGRSYRDAPEVDGLVGIAGPSPLQPGSFAEVMVTDGDEHDLYAEFSG